MTQKIGRPSPAMVVACLALFVALGSGAYAAAKLKPNSVKAKNIKRGAVTGPKIKSNAVSTGKLADGAVSAPKLQNNAATSPKIADLAVNNAKIALNAVQTGKIADDTITAPKIAAGALTKAKFAATGVATNTVALNLNGNCTVVSFSAPGVRPNDVVSFSFREATTAVGSLLAAQPAENTAFSDGLSIRICEVTGIATGAIAIGALQLDYVAIR